MQRFIRIGLCLLAIFLVSSLAACGAGSDSTQNSQQKKVEKIEKEEKKQTESEDQKQTASAETNSNNNESVPNSENTSGSSSSSSNESTTQPTVNNTQTSAGNSQATPVAQPNAVNPAPAEPETVNPPKPVETVTITIIGPKDRGTILGAKKVEISTDDTVMDVLLKATGNKIDVDYSNNYGSVYVEGIDGIYEGDYPGQSGWTYKLNGILVQKSAGEAKVKDGDQIVWAYVGG